MIRLENITKIYNEKVDDTKALDDVSLKIEDGEFVSVMGAIQEVERVRCLR